MTVTSHPTRGGWIEMIPHKMQSGSLRGPTPHGVGGLKCCCRSIRTCFLCPTPHGVGGLKFRLHRRRNHPLPCPTPHGVGGLKFYAIASLFHPPAGPTPHGVGGLKFVEQVVLGEGKRPTPHGVGGLKFVEQVVLGDGERPTPHGVGGLKYNRGPLRCRTAPVPPPTGWVD